MEANPAKLIDFFSGFKQSVIPLFQRAYEWKAREWNILWDDLLEQYESEHDTSHFMGAIVTMPAKSVPVGVSKYLVIDGQQRLTTLVVLMCAIRDALPPEAKPERNRISNHHLTNDGYDGWDYLKLLPTQLDRDAFRELVLGNPDSHDSAIGAAYQHFRGLLSGRDGDGEPIDPRRVLETVERRLMVVSINLGDADDPYLIFESLNFKGAPLTQADLVRNYYLMRFPISDQQRIHDTLWLPMQTRLGDELTEFMRRYLMMMKVEDVRKGEIYAVLKKRLQNQSPDQVEASLSEMSRYSEYHLTFLRPENECDPAARRLLTRLSRWEVSTSHPFLLKLADMRRAGSLAAADFTRCLEIVESYVIRRSVCSIPTNQHKKVFLDLTGKVPETDVAGWLAKTLAEGGAGRRWPKDEEFHAHWVTAGVYGSPVDRCKLLLEVIEEAFGHKEPVDLAEATIEHVLPQTLTPAWRTELGADAGQDWERYVDTIGNLTLTGYNAELSNAPFDRKKQFYAESHFELNKYFTGVDRWDAEAIRKRAEALWEYARRIWWRPES